MNGLVRPYLWMAVALIATFTPSRTSAEDRHEGYYYPDVTSTEVYVSRARALLESNRGRRIGFVTGLTKYLYEQSYAPQFAIFAKGEEAEKLIVVAYGDGTLDTVYRARALFATLTALSRLTPLFREFGVEELFTFFDLAKLLGFTQITVSDGKEFTHQITIR